MLSTQKLLTKELRKKVRNWFESSKETFRSDSDREALLGVEDPDTWEEDNLFLIALAARILEIAKEKKPKQ